MSVRGSTTLRQVAIPAIAALLCLVALVVAAGGGAATSAFSPNVTVVASGLNNPRGLTFGPDGNLYIAEGGTGGATMTTPAQCAQVVPPVGPYSGAFTARILKLAPSGGSPTVVAAGLPSSQTSAALGSLASGVGDLAFVDGRLYAVLAGAGCSHGLLGTSNGVVRVNADGTTTLVANLSAFQASHPVAHPEPNDFEPDGTWYSMVAVRGKLYAVEPNHGEVVRISPTTGAIERVVDVSATQGHIVPTAIAYHGNFFVGNLGTFPVAPGSEKIFKLTPSGRLKVWAEGLSTVLGLDVDSRGRLYVLESMTQPGNPGPAQFGSGMIVRIEHSGAVTTIATGLTFPTGMTFGPDGALYVSNLGFAGPGAGQILKVDVSGIAKTKGNGGHGGHGHGHDNGKGKGRNK
jgi:sugar lactone lactonase YvrE